MYTINKILEVKDTEEEPKRNDTQNYVVKEESNDEGISIGFLKFN